VLAEAFDLFELFEHHGHFFLHVSTLRAPTPQVDSIQFVSVSEVSGVRFCATPFDQIP